MEVTAFGTASVCRRDDAYYSSKIINSNRRQVPFTISREYGIQLYVNRLVAQTKGDYNQQPLQAKTSGDESHHQEKSKGTGRPSPHQSRGAFNALLNKLAKEETAQSAEKAETMLFDRLRSVALNDGILFWSNAADLPYDVLSFNIVLNAWSKALNAPRAEALLGRMVHMHGKGILPFGPNEVSYSTVADAWKRMPGDNAEYNVEEAERVLDLMHEMEDDDHTNRSSADRKEDLVSFNQELDLFAREGFPEAAETAEMMLFDSIREAATSDGQKNIGCDIISFNTVLNCWAKLGNPQRADALLSRLEHLSDIGVLPFGPNSVSFATVISAWANSKLKRAPYECEAILDKVEGLCFDEDYEHFSSSNSPITPTIHMYAATITAWSRSKRSDAAHRAERILERLERLYVKTTDSHLKPNSVLYTSIIQCWGRSKERDALDRAEAIFQRMQQSKDPAVMPNEHTYSALLNAHGNSGLGLKSAERADELLLEVEESDALAANVFIYTNAIKVWARSGHSKSAERAAEILQTMMSSDNALVQPNIYTFTAALDAMIAGKGNNSFDSDQFLGMMKNAGVKPDKVIHEKVEKALEKHGKEI
jgi:hypothetical protein